MLSVLALGVTWVRLGQHAWVGFPAEVLLCQPVDVAILGWRWDVGMEEVTSLATLLLLFGRSHRLSLGLVYFIGVLD